VAWDIQFLFRRYAAEIERALGRRGVSAETAADLTQDTFVRVLGSEPQEVENPRAYLHQVSRNLTIDHQRREKRRPVVPLSDKAFEAVADPAPNAETIVYDRQRLKLVERALAELPERSRRAFALYQSGERPIAEVGTALGLSTTQTWRLVRDCYQHVRRRLDEADAK